MEDETKTINKLSSEVEKLKKQLNNIMNGHFSLPENCDKYCDYIVNYHCRNLEKKLKEDNRNEFERKLKFFGLLFSAIGILGISAMSVYLQDKINERLTSYVDNQIQKHSEIIKINTFLVEARANYDQLLSMHGLLMNSIIEIKENFFLEVCKSGNIKALKVLINSKKQDINMFDVDGKCGLYYASMLGCLECVNEFIKNGALVDCFANNGRTPLLESLINKNLEIANILINASANVNVQDLDSLTPLIAAVQFGNVTLLNKIIENGADLNPRLSSTGNNALLEATDMDKTEETLILLDKYGDIDTQNFEGDTALIFAIKHKNTVLIKKLLEKGANLNKENNSGESALKLAILDVNPNEDIIRLLLKHGADKSLAIKLASAANNQTSINIIKKIIGYQ